MAVIEQAEPVVAARRETRIAGGRRAPRIGLLAHVGMQNLGDEILFASALEYYRGRFPDGHFVAFTIDPADTRERYGLADVHPVRPTALPEEPTGHRGRLVRYALGIRERLRFFGHQARFGMESVRRLRGLDFVVVPGSSQFIDAYGGPWGFPLTLLRWALVARLARVPLCFLSLGAEKLHHPLSRFMVRGTVALASYVSLRDTVSRDRLAEQGVRREIPLTPDLSLGYPVPEAPPRLPSAGSGTVGINPIPYFHPVFWRAVDEARYRVYLTAMVAFTEEILRDGHRVVLYATTQWADKVPAEDLLAELRERLPAEMVARVSLPEVHALEDLWAVLAGVDWVVASRYHGVATALLMRKPVVGIAYEQKTADLMGTLGLREYSIPIDQIDGPSLYALLGRLRANDAKIREALDAGARRDRALVHAQYEAVLASYSPNRVEA